MSANQAPDRWSAAGLRVRDEATAGQDRKTETACRFKGLSRLLLLAVLAFGVVEIDTGPALAAKVAKPDKSRFSAAEQQIIARNKSLEDLVVRRPDLVRRALQLIDAQATAPRSLPGLGEVPRPRDFDLTRDPDLGTVELAAPEAAHDLFVLIKKASTNRPK